MKEVYSNTREKMTKTVSVLGKDYASIRAGRANPGVLDKVLVDYYGVPTPINQMAAISVSDTPAFCRKAAASRAYRNKTQMPACRSPVAFRF